MKKVAIGAFLMLSTFTVSAANNGKLDMEKLYIDMDKDASRAILHQKSE